MTTAVDRERVSCVSVWKYRARGIAESSRKTSAFWNVAASGMQRRGGTGGCGRRRC
jgi:hypothetical protein